MTLNEAQSLRERLKKIEKALFGSSIDETEETFLSEYESALKELLKGNRQPLKALKEKYGNLAERRMKF